MENIIFRNNTIYNNTGFIDMETNYQSGDTPPVGYPATKVRNISFVGNRALGGGTGATFKCSVHDFCEELTVMDNFVANSQQPWHCEFIETYTASGNSPSGLEQCMHDSMDRNPTPAPAPTPMPPPGATCEDECVADGHCCTGSTSSYNHPVAPWDAPLRSTPAASPSASRRAMMLTIRVPGALQVCK